LGGAGLSRGDLAGAKLQPVRVHPTGHSSSSSTTSTPPSATGQPRLTNKTRTDALLKLLAAQRNGWANETAWAERIREHLLARRGRAPDQRQHTDPAAEPSLRAPLPQPAIVDF
jgi:hypothetical protein